MRKCCPYYLTFSEDCYVTSQIKKHLLHPKLIISQNLRQLAELTLKIFIQMICPNISSNGSSQNERALGSMLCLSRLGTWGPLHSSFVFTSASICSSIFHTQTMASLNLEERWQTKTSSVLERSKLMFNNILLSDIKFAFPKADSNSMIPAHKYVLAISSVRFTDVVML